MRKFLAILLAIFAFGTLHVGTAQDWLGTTIISPGYDINNHYDPWWTANFYSPHTTYYGYYTPTYRYYYTPLNYYISPISYYRPLTYYNSVNYVFRW